MKHKKLQLRREHIRQLTSPELRGAQGGMEVTSSGPDRCPPMSPHQSCTGCASINASCPSEHVSCRPTCSLGECTVITIG